MQTPGHQTAMDSGGERTFLRCDPNDSFEREPADWGTKFLEKNKMIELRTAIRIYKMMNDAEVNMITVGEE